MKNTIENKANFLLMNYAFNRGSIKSKQGVGVVFPVIDIINNPEYYYCEQTPLSSITDEDAIEVAKMTWADTIGGRKFINAIDGRYEILDTLSLGGHFKYYIVDYLRSKGYALPFHNLSVDELISYGWIKLKE